MTAILMAALCVAVAAGVRGLWSPCGLSMLSSLNPVAEASRGHRFGATAAWYVAGAVVGGAALGGVAAVLALLWNLVGAPVTLGWVLGGVAALLTAAADLRVLGISLPENPRQVDAHWLTRYRRWVYAAGFGVQIGSGFATYVMTAANYLLVVLGALTGSVRDGVLVGTVFGLVRGLTILTAGLATSPARLQLLMRGVDRLQDRSRRALALVQVAVVAVAAAELAGPVAAAVVLGVALGAVVGRLIATRARATGRGRDPRARTYGAFAPPRS